MTGKDTFYFILACPVCRTNGRVDVSESDGYRYARGNHDRVNKFAGPFVEDPKGDYRCETCGSRVTESG